MKRAQVIIQNFELLDCGGNLTANVAFTAPQNIVQITAPENFNVTRVTFQVFIPGINTGVGPIDPNVTLNSSPPAAPGDGYMFFTSVLSDAITNEITVFAPQQTISFECYVDARLQGNFFAAMSCPTLPSQVVKMTAVWEGYYYE